MQAKNDMIVAGSGNISGARRPTSDHDPTTGNMFSPVTSPNDHHTIFSADRGSGTSESMAEPVSAHKSMPVKELLVDGCSLADGDQPSERPVSSAHHTQIRANPRKSVSEKDLSAFIGVYQRFHGFSASSVVPGLRGVRLSVAKFYWGCR
jgi:hypothetical protein